MDLKELPVTAVKPSRVMRLMHRVLPLERKLFPLVDGYGNGPGLLSVPWGDFRLHFPRKWLAHVCDAVYKGPHENNPEFFEILAPLVPELEAGTIVDVGAAIGVYILNFRALTNAPIIGYEPSPLAFQLADYNVRSNHLSGIKLKHVACGDTQGQVELNVGINSFINCGDSSERETHSEHGFEPSSRRYRPDDEVVSVPSVRLDDEFDSAGPVRLLKIDCEGFEYQILSGAAEILRKWRPHLFIELHPQDIGNYGHSVGEVCELLAPNYDLDFWDYGRSERSASRRVRFFGRYSQRGHRFKDKAAMMEAMAQPCKPSQMFLLGRPK